MIVSLPMYDWPHMRAAYNDLWANLAAELVKNGFDAPAQLTRPADVHAHWRLPDLLLSQTCAMPYRLGLWRYVNVLGAIDFGLNGCAPGQYYSVIIANAQDKRNSIADFHHASCAVNAQDSQSGYAALARVFDLAGVKYGALHITGAHSHSISAVADRQAQLATIDAVSWRLACQTMPEVQSLKVIGHTPATPGLPLISSVNLPVAAIRRSVQAAFSRLPKSLAEHLGIKRFIPADNDLYRINPWIERDIAST